MRSTVLILYLFLTLSVASIAQSLYIYPATVSAPRGSYQTVTAVVNGVNDKTVTWSTTGGTLVGTNPCVVNEPCTIALYTTTAGTYTVTATSNSNHTVLGTSTITITASPTVLTGHPRFLFTSTNLPGYIAKAAASTNANSPYQAMKTLAISYYTADNAVWSWTCNDGTGQPSTSEVETYKEVDAYYYALMALLDPSDPTYNWSCYAHDVGVYLMTQYPAQGFGSSALGANEWSNASYAMALMPDWLIGSGAVSTVGDLATTRAFLAYMAQFTLGYGSAPNPSSAYNSTAMFSTGTPYDLDEMRANAGNNYNLSRILYLTAAGLTFNDNTTDDPPMTNTCGATRYQVCPDFTAGSLHAYGHYLFGGPLYDYWAHLEDPSVGWQAYNTFFPGSLPTQPTCEFTDLAQHPCFGDGRGGESSEGSYYQYSMYHGMEAMNMLYTSGNNDPTIWGPQASLGTSSWWDQKLVSDLEFLTGPAQQSSVAHPAWNYLGVGDNNTYTRSPLDEGAEMEMMVADTLTGRTDRTNALKWINYDTAWGGPLGTSWGCTSDCGYDFDVSNINWSGYFVEMFMALGSGDPVAGTLPTDPRPSLPTDLYNGSENQHLMVRDNFTSSGTLFSLWFPNSLQNHEYQYDGRFDVFANGEYITKGRTVFDDYNLFMALATNQNEMSILNSTGSGCTTYPCTNWQEFANGGLASQGTQAGLISVQHAEMPTYVAAVSDTTHAYNGDIGGDNAYIYSTYNDIQAASRSIVFLRGTKQVVTYDRALVGHAASVQAVNLVTTGPPTITGNTASWSTRLATQKAYYTSLLPASGSITNMGLPCSTANDCDAGMQAGDWEPYAELQVTPTGTPLSTQFLAVLEFGPASLTKTATTLVTSTAGQSFDGALIGSSLVMFMRQWPATLSGVTYPASGATTQYISDLTPNTLYTIAGAGAPTSATTDTAGMLTFAATGTGSITVGVPPPYVTSVVVTPNPLIMAIGGSAQQFTANCHYSDASVVICTSTSTWTSSNTAAATITSGGLATALTVGGSTISATSSGVTGTASLTSENLPSSGWVGFGVKGYGVK